MGVNMFDRILGELKRQREREREEGIGNDCTYK